MRPTIIAVLMLQACLLAGCPKSETKQDDKKSEADDKKDKGDKKKSKDDKGDDDDDKKKKKSDDDDKKSAKDDDKGKKDDDDKGKKDDDKDDDKDGKSLKLTCASTIGALGDDAKKGFTGTCPAGCTSGTVWGTGSYTTDSPICVAAVHAGATTADKGGTVTVAVSDGLKAYKGSTKNGIKTSDWGSFDKTFTFSGVKGDSITLTCSDSIKSLGTKVDDDFQGTCPKSCTTGSVWGTDTYTTDSPICVAAVHAGVVKAADGGDVHVKVIAGKSSYKGSTKNGVKTSDWGAFEKSFTVE
jgi:hypothetical protein